MVGRQSELEVLRTAFAAAVESAACRLVTVIGAAGVGKSRLVAEFLGGLDDARVVQGRCLAYGEGITYRPVGEVVRELQVELEELAPDPRVLAALRGLVNDDEASSTEEISWAVRKLLVAAAAVRPLVCVFDDVELGRGHIPRPRRGSCSPRARRAAAPRLHGEARPARPQAGLGEESSSSTRSRRTSPTC